MTTDEIQYSRAATMVGSVNATDRTVRLAFSSEHPVMRRDASGELYWEILDHSSADSVDLSRMIGGGGPVLKDHDLAQHIGAVIDIKINTVEKKGRAKVLFFDGDPMADRVFRAIVDGYRPHVSVSYLRTSYKLDGRDKDGLEVRRYKWTPYEISSVSVPEDPNVGVGRSLLMPDAAQQKQTAETMSKLESDSDIKKEAEVQKTPATVETRSISAPAIIVSDTQSHDQIRSQERDRVKTIRDMGNKFGFSTAATRAIDEGTSAEAFMRSIGDSWSPPQEGLKTAGLDKIIGMSEKDKRSWSYIKALAGAKRGNLTGFEREVSDEAARALGIDLAPTHFVIPADMYQKRDLEAGTNSEGGFGVQTSVGNLIEMFEAHSLAAMLGAPMLTGLMGNLTLPRESSGTTSSWVDEEGSVSASAPALGSVSIAPKRLATKTIYSDQLLIQSSFSVDQWVRNRQAKSEALAVDLAYFDGTGSSNQPTGITATSGVNAGVTFGGAQEWADFVNMWTELATDHTEEGNLAWVMSAATIAKGLTTAKIASTDSMRIINETVNMQFSILGLPVYKLGQALTVAHQVLLGDFSRAGIASWGARKVVVDPFTLAATGQNVIVCNSFWDIFVSTPTAFSKSVDSGAQ